MYILSLSYGASACIWVAMSLVLKLVYVNMIAVIRLQPQIKCSEYGQISVFISMLHFLQCLKLCGG